MSLSHVPAAVSHLAHFMTFVHDLKKRRFAVSLKLFHLQVRPEDFKFHGKHLFGSVPCDHGNPSETVFRFHENKSWEPMFDTIDLNKHIIFSKI